MFRPAFATHCPLRVLSRPAPPTRHSVCPRAMRDARGKAVSKNNLPSKVCAHCGRPFTWRKKWERSWDEVICCSKRCRTALKSTQKGIIE